MLRRLQPMCVIALLICWLAADRSVAQRSAASALRGPDVEALLQQGKPTEALPILNRLHDAEPHNVRVCYQLGLAYTQLQEFVRAAEFYRKALKLNPGFVAARKNLGTVLWFSNQKEASVQEFRTVLRSLPNDPVSHLYLGSQAYEQRRFAEAKRHFEKAGDLAMQNPEALPMVLETYLATRDLSVLERVTQQLMTAHDPDPQLVFQVGVVLGRYGRSREAVAAFERIRERYPDQQALLLNLSAAQLELGEVNRAIQNLESLMGSHSSNPEVYLLLGEAYDKAGQAEKGYAAFNRAIELAPKSEEGYLALSNFASAHHNNSFGLKTIERGLQQIPGSSKLLFQQGVLWALESNLEAAAQSFQIASQADTAWGLPLLALGIVQLQAAKLQQAAGTFRQAIAKLPGDYRPSYFLGTTLTRAGAQSDPVQQKEALVAFRKAVSLDPSNPQSRVALGQAYLATNQILPAVVELEKAVQLDPRDSTALYQLGLAYRKQGKAREAEAVLRRFQEVKNQLKEEESQERKALVIMLKTAKAP